MNVGRQLRLMTAVLAVLTLGVVGTATAGNLSMSGEWFMNRGPLVDIPINGGPGLCFGGASTGCARQFGAAAGFRPFGGGVPGGGVVTVGATGTTPVAFTIPPNLFNQANPMQTAPVTLVATVVQLQSQFVLSGPPATTIPTTKVPAANRPAQFMKNAWSLDPGQAARVAKSFAWCPGVGGGCLNATSASAPWNGIVRYKNTNPNAFGGTMAMMLSGTAVVSVTQSAGALLVHALVGGGTAQNPQHPGRGYATSDTDVIAAGPIHAGFSTGPTCTNAPGQPPTPAGCGLILTQGSQVGTAPADNNINWGFPWTTGTVTAQNVQLSPGGGAGTTTMTAKGTDSRNGHGTGKITLVAGGTTHRVGVVTDFAQIDIVNLEFAGIPAPGLSPTGIIALAMLMTLTAGFTFRRRLASAFE